MKPRTPRPTEDSSFEYKLSTGNIVADNLVRNKHLRESIVKNPRFDPLFASTMGPALQDPVDFLEGGRYFTDIEKAVQDGATNVETVANVGIAIGYGISQDNPSTIRKITGYLNAVMGLDYANVITAGERVSKTIHGIQEYVTMEVASELPMKPATLMTMKAVQRTIDHLVKVFPDEPLLGQFSEAAMILQSGFRKQYQAIELAERYSDSFADSELSEEEIRSMAMLLTRETIQHRKYGTKAAYTEASIGGSWMFYDGKDWKDQTDGKLKGSRAVEQYANIVAVVFHSPYTKLNSLKTKLERKEDGRLVIGGGFAQAKPDVGFYIFNNGAIAIDPDGLQEIGFLGLPKPQELALRAEISSIFYDLSMPVYKNRPERTTFATLTTPERETFNPIQDLLIPRTRFIGTEQPVSETSETDAGDSRKVREHNVVWFVRTLPAGYHASPEAQEMAAKYGVVLADNETFVRDHVRGSANEVLGHRAVRRSQIKRP